MKPLMTAAAAGLCAAALALPAALSRPAMAQTPVAAPSCAPEGDLKFICGLVNVEDFLPVDHGRYLVGGSFKLGSDAMYLIDTRSKTARIAALSVGKVDPLYADCPGAPDFAKLSTHGVDVRKGAGGRTTVFMVNHGGRESIEVFSLAPAEGKAEWVGCVVMPEGTSTNSVASLADRSLLITKMLDTRGPVKVGQIVRQGMVTGLVYHWVPGKGLSVVPGSELSGDNGIVASPDGKTVFINAYGTKEIWRTPLSGEGPRASVKVDFNPDNLRWAPDGTIFTTGQYVNPDRLAEPEDWAVSRIDPKTITATLVLKEKGAKAFDNATTTVQVGKTLYFGTFRGDRIAYRDLP